MRHLLGTGDLIRQLDSTRHTARRWENQLGYAVDDETASLEAWHRRKPINPDDDPQISAWLRQVEQWTRTGRCIERVRVLEEPPTPYQQWALWLGPRSTAAGEDICYLPRSYVRERGPAPYGDADWWLLDDERVLLLHFDLAGRLTRVELDDDAEAVLGAVMWWNRMRRAAQDLAGRGYRPAV